MGNAKTVNQTFVFMACKKQQGCFDVITDRIVNNFLHKGQGIGHSCTISNEGTSEEVIF